MEKITQLSQLDLNQTYSYADYLTWRFEETVELIKGKIMQMSPAPTVNHQRLERKLLVAIDSYLRDKQCEIFPAPFDVRLYDRKKSQLANQEVYTVVQPDLCVICNPELLDKRGCNGAPEWIIEIVSKSTSKKDMQIKYALYQESGVSEYWLVYPELQTIQQFVLDERSHYQLQPMNADNLMNSHLFPELIIDSTALFAKS